MVATLMPPVPHQHDARLSRTAPVSPACILRSKNYPSYGFGAHGDGDEARICDPPQQFRVVPGLWTDDCPGAVSFESVERPGLFLRHCCYVMWLHPHDGTAPGDDDGGLYRRDATFHRRHDRFFPGSVAFESVNFPGFFVRHEHFRLKIARLDGSDLSHNDASFYESECLFE